MRRNVGRVGFHGDGVLRQCLRQAAQLQGALVGHGTAKPELETQGNERLRLLHTAVEGMGDAAAHRHFAQALEQAVGRAAHVQDHRQAEAPRQLQLRAVKLLLPRWIQSIGKKIQPDFADGRLKGEILPLKGANMVLIGDMQESLAPVARQLESRLQWSI